MFFIRLASFGALISIISALPPCYKQTGTDPTPFYTSTAPVCSSAPPGAALPQGVSRTLRPATELVATITVSSQPMAITYTPGKATGPTTIVETDAFTTMTTVASAGDLIWLPVPLPIIAGAPPPPPFPPIIPNDGDVTPELPDACTASPVQACAKTCSESIFPSSYSIYTTSQCEETCSTTTACNPVAETSTATVPFSFGPLQTLDPAGFILYDDDSPVIEGLDPFYEDPTLIARYQEVLHLDTADGPLPDPTCNGQGDSVQQAEGMANLEDFCNNNKGNVVDPSNLANNGQGNFATYVQTTTRRQQTEIRVGYDVNDPDHCPVNNDYTSHFLDLVRCNTVLETILNGCDVSTTANKHGGQLKDQCAIYSFTPQSTDELTCDGQDLTGVGKTVTFTVDQARDAISQYCGDKSLYLDPSAEPPDPNDFQQFPTPGIPDEEYRYPPMTAKTVINISTSFAQDQSKCKPKKKFKIKDIEDECKRLLSTAVNGCNTDTTSEKWGGTVLESQGPDGCIEWTIFAYGSG